MRIAGSPQPGLGFNQGVEGDYQQVREDFLLEKKNEYIRKVKQLFTLFINMT